MFRIKSVVDIKEEDARFVVGSDGAVNAFADRLSSSAISVVS